MREKEDVVNSALKESSQFAGVRSRVKCQSEKGGQTPSFKLMCKHRRWMLLLLKKRDLHPQKSEQLLSGQL